MKKILFTVLCLGTALIAGAQALTGTYTIGGTNPKYATIADATKDLDAKGISGSVIFNIRPGIYKEMVVVPRVKGASLTNTVTFQSETKNADDVTITAKSDGKLPNGTADKSFTFKLDNPQYIKVKYLTIENT